MQEENKRGGARPDAPGNQGQDRPGSQHSTKPDETPIYLTGNSTLQTGSEHRHDQSIDPRDDRSIDVNRDDQHEIRAGRLTGRDQYENDQDTTD